MHYDYDLITIGAGSGGVAASRRSAALGARVLIAEASRVGGTCVIRGCVPKKLMMYAAGFADSLQDARGYGWDFGEARFDMGRWAATKAKEIDRLENIGYPIFVIENPCCQAARKLIIKRVLSLTCAGCIAMIKPCSMIDEA